MKNIFHIRSSGNAICPAPAPKPLRYKCGNYFPYPCKASKIGTLAIDGCYVYPPSFQTCMVHLVSTLYILPVTLGVHQILEACPPCIFCKSLFKDITYLRSLGTASAAPFICPPLALVVSINFFVMTVMEYEICWRMMWGSCRWSLLQ